jgi:hypothetical protein
MGILVCTKSYCEKELPSQHLKHKLPLKVKGGEVIGETR